MQAGIHYSEFEVRSDTIFGSGNGNERGNINGGRRSSRFNQEQVMDWGGSPGQAQPLKIVSSIRRKADERRDQEEMSQKSNFKKLLKGSRQEQVVANRRHMQVASRRRIRPEYGIVLQYLDVCTVTYELGTMRFSHLSILFCIVINLRSGVRQRPADN